jgi:two-component system CheB/CheR fusion protein
MHDPQETDTPPTQDSANTPPSVAVVGIGASAGGLAPLEELFEALPPKIGVSYVVLQHLSPDFRSVMNELLGRRTAMPVIQVEEGMTLEPDHVYLLPPKKEMVVEGGRLHLRDQDRTRAVHMPIDLFFRSMAAEYGERAVGIVLSGTGSDGSRGIADLRDAGALTIVQSPETAKFDGMPNAAIGTGLVDLVLSPKDMAKALVEYTMNPGVMPQLGERTRTQGGDLGEILKLLHDSYGIDFTHYKPTTVNRRIDRRLAMHHNLPMEDYVARLVSRPEELNQLYRDLLIGVTRFFRDPEAFEILREQVVPELIEAARGRNGLRVWVAGCATGEEAYSIAILLNEEAARRGLNPEEIKVFATDVHRASLDVASSGRYPEESLADVPENQRSRYFEQKADGWQVIPSIRKMLVFAPHNLIKDAPFTKIDLVTCRNLLIYLKPEAQMRAISLFHFALRLGGKLFLGPSESIGDFEDDFRALDRTWKIYEKMRDVRLPATGSLHDMPIQPSISEVRRTGRPPLNDARLFRTYDVLLQEYLPAGFLVDEDRQLLHSFGDARNFLHPPVGRNTGDILDMVSPELRVAIGTAMQRASRDQTPVTYSRVLTAVQDAKRSFNVRVLPVLDRPSNCTFFLVCMEEDNARPVVEVMTAPEEGRDLDIADSLALEKIQQLEMELKQTRENLQATIEEMESSNEELNATNEELVASNEELQSTNEELHSVNEELYSVNAEYQRKIAELTELTSDMNNLLASTEIGTVFLDSSFCIRKFTKAIGQTFNLREQDIGRPLSDISSSLQFPDLLREIRAVLDSGEQRSREVRNREGTWFLMRIHPYRTDRGVVDGVVATFVDISEQKSVQRQLVANEERFRLIEALASDGMFDWNLESNEIYLSARLKAILGYEADEIPNRFDAWQALIIPEDLPEHEDALRKHLEQDEPFAPVLRYRHKNGSQVWMLCRGHAIKDGEGPRTRMVGAMTDITSLKESEAELRRYQERLSAALDIVKAGAWSYEIVTSKMSWDERTDEMFGFSPGSFSGRYEDWRDRVHPKDIEAVEEAFDKALEDTGWLEAEYRLTLPTGIRHIHMRGELIRSDSGRPKELLGVCIDRTEERSMVSRMQKQSHELERSYRELDEFAHVASHDLKAPLRAVENLAEWIVEDAAEMLPEKSRSHLDSLRDRVRRMSAMIDDMLEYSRLGREPEEPEPVDLHDLVERALSLLQMPDGFEVQAQKLPTVIGSRTALSQIFRNLLDNAIKHHDRPEGRIEVSAERREGDWLFRVRDDGPGIPEAHRDRIFFAFQRLPNAKDGEGSGIGLALVKKAVDQAGGRIWVESGPERGTLFSFTWPAEGAAQQEAEPA